MLGIIQPAFIIMTVIIGATAIVYFYFSTDIFTDILKRPLRMISAGMLAINLGIVSVAFMAYESSRGVDTNFLGLIPTVCFYALYFLGAFMIIFGSRKFSRSNSSPKL